MEMGLTRKAAFVWLLLIKKLFIVINMLPLPLVPGVVITNIFCSFMKQLFCDLEIWIKHNIMSCTIPQFSLTWDNLQKYRCFAAVNQISPGNLVCIFYAKDMQLHILVNNQFKQWEQINKFYSSSPNFPRKLIIHVFYMQLIIRFMDK